MRETRREKQLRQGREKQQRFRDKKKEVKTTADLAAVDMEALKNRRGVREMTPDEIDLGIEWMSDLIVPDGHRAGQRFALEDWQIEWTRQAMAPEKQVGALSIARKNAKSMLNVLAEAAFLVGPWNRHGWNGIVCADVGEHAGIMFKYLRLLTKINSLDILFKQAPPPGKAFGANGAMMDFLAADSTRTGHASNADIVWLDEAGAFTENQRPLWNALYSSISSRNGKFLCLGNQRTGPMFLELERRALIDPLVHWVRYQAPMDCDPLDESVWETGNPGLGAIKSWDYMRGKAMDAEVSPANMTYFMSFDLNMDVDPTKSTIVTVKQWRACLDEEAELAGEPVVVGIDMGGSVSMSAAVAVGVKTGAVRMWAAFSAIPDILSRGREDGVDNTYVLMRERGELRLYSGEHVDPSMFIADVLEDLQAAGCPILGLGADRYRRAELSQALTRAGARFPVSWRGVGLGPDGIADIGAFQRLVYDRELRSKQSLGMVNAILHSHLEHDTNNNVRLMKNKSRGRIDLLSAGVIAAGLYLMYKRSGQGQVVGELAPLRRAR